MSALRPLSVYIHIPFCKSKCAYCDFASWPGREDVWVAYFAALCEEIRAAGDGKHRVETIFFGGGTPSLAPEESIGAALQAVREAFPVAPEAEVSLEANPGTLSMEKLRAYREMGVNRLSIGVQSFDACLLREIGHIHTPGEAKEADIGIAGGKDGGALFVKGQPPRAVHGDLAEILLAEIQRILQ